MIKQPKTPVIKCLPRSIMNGWNDGMKFWCPYCQTWHLHGRGNGHRTAHCRDSSSRNQNQRYYDNPFYETGYTIKMMSKAELREIARAINNYLGAQT